MACLSVLKTVMVVSSRRMGSIPMLSSKKKVLAIECKKTDCTYLLVDYKLKKELTNSINRNVTEWPKVAAWKAVGLFFSPVGSNPTVSAKK